LQFQGSATDFSANNTADYILIGSSGAGLVFFNNAGASFTVIPPPPTVTISATDPSASEVPATDTGKFRISRAGCTDSDVNVFYTVSGTATNAVDYRRLRGHVTIRFGAPSVAITLRPIDDTISEPDETAILTLSPDPSYIMGSPSTATVTIHSNE
jgi:hypothetical protein